MAVAAVAFFVGRAGSEVDVASPTPLPSSAPVTIVFGTALDPVSGEAVELTSRFRAADPIAYSVRLPTAPGTDTILVEIVRVGGETETVVQPRAEQGIVAAAAVIAFMFAVPTADLLEEWGAGDYAMRIYLPGSTGPVATGRFTLVETPDAP